MALLDFIKGLTVAFVDATLYDNAVRTTLSSVGEDHNGLFSL
jgi:hypothetical protein